MASVMALRCSTMHGYVAAVRYDWHRALRSDPSSGSPLPAELINALAAEADLPPLFRQHFPREWLATAAALSDDPVVELAFVVGWFFFLRVSEYCTTTDRFGASGSRLRARDMTLVANGLRVNIAISKTDQVRRGSAHIRGPTGSATCPVEAFRRYVAARPGLDPDGPALVWADGRAFTSRDLNRFIAQVTAAHGATSSLYSSHSLRSGGVTAAHAAGHEVPLLIREGRWASIDGLMIYLRMSPNAGAALSVGQITGIASRAAAVPADAVFLFAPRR